MIHGGDNASLSFVSFLIFGFLSLWDFVYLFKLLLGCQLLFTYVSY